MHKKGEEKTGYYIIFILIVLAVLIYLIYKILQTKLVEGIFKGL